MNEREVLKLAAKAAGYWDKELKCYTGFDPLIDDGDALRLAVKLSMCLKHHYFDGDWYVMVSHEKGWSQEKAEPDQYAATRRAIVRAAA